MKPLVATLLAVGAIGAGVLALYRSGGGSGLSGARRRRVDYNSPAKKLATQRRLDRKRGAKTRKYDVEFLHGPAEVRELQLFCENDGELYRQQVQPIEKNLTKRMQKGTYDHTKAVKLWGYLAENCAKKYAKQFADGRDWHKMFSTADRREVAKAFADSFRDERLVDRA